MEGPEGFAVFASKNIKKGDVIEEFIFRQGPWRSYDLDARVGFLHQTSFMRSCPCPTCRQHGVPFLLMGGAATVYTHAADSNADVKLPDEAIAPINNMLVGEIIATENIKKDDLITVNYVLHYSPQKLSPEGVRHQQDQRFEQMLQEQQQEGIRPADIPVDIPTEASTP